MECSKCGKIIDDNSKFCEFCGSKISKGYQEVADQVTKEKQSDPKKQKLFSYLRSAVLVFSVFALATFIIDLVIETAPSYYIGIPAGILAMPATILVVFLYGKMAKKFDL